MGSQAELFHVEHQDFAADSIAVMILLPEDLAATFTDLGEHGPAHMTLAHVKHGTDEQFDGVRAIVAEVRGDLSGHEVSLAGLDYFDNPDARPAFVRLDAPADLKKAQADLVERLQDHGLEVSHAAEWRPHASLAILDPGEEFAGTVPTGEFKTRDIVLSRGGELTRFDRLGHVAGKWQALSEDGDVLGEFDTEAEARERLRQIEAAKSARADLAAPDEETIKAWLIEHISDVRTLSRPRMAMLKSLEDQFPYLKPPAVEAVYRGLRNIAPAALARWSESSDPVRDKSWSVTREAAQHFARAEWTLEVPVIGKTGAILSAKAAPELLLLNPDLLATLSGVGDVIHPIWDEPLSIAILDEQEVLALDGLEIESVEPVVMTARADSRVRRYRAPTVITEPKTLVETMRKDAVEIGQSIGDVNGWVTYQARYSRGNNIQVYPEFGNVREFRPWPVIKDPESLAGGPGSPVELRHSADLLTPDTVRGVARGAVMTFEADDSTFHTFGEFRAWDRKLIESIEAPRATGGTPDMSVAFRVKIDKRPGHDDDGNPFDQRVAKYVINSVAAEPFGRGKTTKVLSRADSGIEIYSRADMLAMVSGQQAVPTRPIFYDFSPHRESRADERPSKDQSTMNMALMQMLLDSHGMTVADMAGAMSLTEDELRALMAGDAEMTPDQMTAFSDVLAGKMQDAEEPPAVDEEKAAKIADLERQLQEARGDRDTLRKDAAKMVTRADADAEIAAAVVGEGQQRAITAGTAIALARATGGQTFTPDARKDAAGADEPPTIRDWQRAAITNSFGLMALTDEDKAKAATDRADALSRIDGAPELAVDYMIGIELAAVEKRLDAKNSKIDAVKAAVTRAATNNAESDRSDSNSDEVDGLAAASQNQRALADGKTQGESK